jgi:predicted AlkP superfamily phosphohydrolase/phosphomutase
LLDSTVGRLVEAAGDRANCIVLSDHGFGPAPRLAVYRRALARELGLMAGEGVGGFHSLRAWLERHNVVDGDRLRRWLAGTPLRRLLSRISRLARRKEQEAWRESRAYLVVLHKYVGGIGINLDPADPQYEPLRASLIERLPGVRDPDSGEPVVTAVWRREEVYHGARLAACPDIVFRIDERYGFAHGESPGGRLVCPKDFRSQGIHRDEGVLVLAGPDVRRTMRNAECGMRNEEESAQGAIEVQDVTATALYLLDMPVPADMDGRVIDEAITAAFHQGHPLRREDVAEEAADASIPAARWRSIEDEEAVADRLRELGYLD